MMPSTLTAHDVLQAKAMEELHTMQLDELEALRAYVSQVRFRGRNLALTALYVL